MYNIKEVFYVRAMIEAQNYKKTGNFSVKRNIIIFGILLLLFSCPEQLWADKHGYVRKVVIDPGHGGRDPGALGRYSQEKDIVLAISLKLGNYIKEHYHDVEVVYTRTKDEFIELHQRAQIANDHKADLFISVHCNGAASSRAFGTETFVMGLQKSQANLEVAKKENASILLEDNYMENYDGYDPNSPEANIIFTLYQNAFLDQSLGMASLVQNQFRTRAGRHDRGVKQGPFLVLYRVAMPGILVEAGFLTNPAEEDYLNSEQGQAHIASAIFRAFREYKESQDSYARQLEQLARNPHSALQSISNGQNPTIPAGVAPPQPSNSAPSSSPANRQETAPIQNTNGIVFRVQFATLSQQKPLDSTDFKGLKKVNFYFHDGLYKYTVGEEPSLEAAAKLQEQMKKAGYKDAFVVAFQHNQRISPAEAMQLLRSQQ